ncbi:hypothetical protein F2Q65_12545 [Thiohalocapsa marina]|uniref:FeoB-associated Cys-rich membrane protein n=1 Tax=Thiohalocapsa marina TaxID=424902 RepID=A0A5M8FK81_9GAMM|nr:FeoB-associated Cys-rich membrane protein [Thiohalocapsa marina]KAA6184400.1 hypothetical protein F2Q65_12545 [Thiohalocapsa marina]
MTDPAQQLSPQTANPLAPPAAPQAGGQFGAQAGAQAGDQASAGITAQAAVQPGTQTGVQTATLASQDAPSVHAAPPITLLDAGVIGLVLGLSLWYLGRQFWRKRDGCSGCSGCGQRLHERQGGGCVVGGCSKLS